MKAKNGDTITSLRKELKLAKRHLKLATSRLAIIAVWAKMGGPSGYSVSEANVLDIERIASETLREIKRWRND